MSLSKSANPQTQNSTPIISKSHIWHPPLIRGSCQWKTREFFWTVKHESKHVTVVDRSIVW